MQNNPNIPKLRFKGFEGEWNVDEFGNIVFLRKEKYDPNKNLKSFPCIELDCIEKESGRLLTTYNGKELKSIKNIFYKNDVLYGKLRPYLKKFFMPDFDGVCSTEIWVFNGKKVKNNLLKSLIQINRFNYYVNISSGSRMPRAEWSFLKSIPFSFPDSDEQQKIASFLENIDEWIGNLKEQKENLEKYKKGMMQKIFAQKIKFKDENGKEFEEWKEKKLEECLNYTQPTKYIVKSTKYNDNYTIPVLTAGKTFILGYTNEEDNIFNSKNLPVIIFDDFTTTVQFVDFVFKVKSSAMKILTPKENIDIRCIYEILKTTKYEVGGHGRQWISKYSKLKINVPSYQEQQKITEFLTSIDKLIDSKQEQIAKAEEWKKGLMQQMFV